MEKTLIAETVITSREIVMVPGMDIGTVPRMLAERGFKITGGVLLPILYGVVEYWYDPLDDAYHYKQYEGYYSHVQERFVYT